nr:hypothetical protein GCM10020185_12680 [Pseudomonas brassicacearum subsp. brassicacearum]
MRQTSRIFSSTTSERAWKNLLHDQADGQVAAVVDAQSSDGRVQVSDFLGGAQQWAVDHLYQACRESRIAADHFAQVADADFRVFGGPANLQGHFR